MNYLYTATVYDASMQCRTDSVSAPHHRCPGSLLLTYRDWVLVSVSLLQINMLSAHSSIDGASELSHLTGCEQACRSWLSACSGSVTPGSNFTATLEERAPKFSEHICLPGLQDYDTLV